jgi:hypothetical protein
VPAETLLAALLLLPGSSKKKTYPYWKYSFKAATLPVVQHIEKAQYIPRNSKQSIILCNGDRNSRKIEDQGTAETMAGL